MEDILETHGKNVKHITGLIHTIQEQNVDNGTSALVITGLNTLILMRICARLNIDLTDLELELGQSGELEKLIDQMPKNLGGLS